MTDLQFDATTDAETLTETISKINTIVDEFRFRSDHDGITVTACDAANVAMCDVELSADAFDSYASTEFVMGVNVTRVLDVLGLADSDEIVTLTFDDKFHIDGDGFDFDISGIDPDSVRQEPDLPDLELPAIVEVATDRFERAIRGCEMVSDHITVRADPADETIEVTASGDVDDAHFEWGADDVHIESWPSDPVESMFSIDYMEDIVKAFHGEAPIRIEFGDEFPIRFTQPFADGAGDCTMMCAPRISSD